MRWAYDRWRDRRSLGGRLQDVAAQLDRAGRERRLQARHARAKLDRRDAEAVVAAEPLAHEDDAFVPMPALSPELAEQYAAIEARAERNRLRWLELEAGRARERERGVPRTLPGVHPLYRLP